MEERHSGLGLASFFLGIISGLTLVALFVVAGIMETSSPDGIDEESVEATLLGLGLLAFMALALASFVLGVAGLFQANRKKIFAVFGTLFSAIAAFGTLSIVLIGLTLS